MSEGINEKKPNADHYYNRAIYRTTITTLNLGRDVFSLILLTIIFPANTIQRM